MTQNTVIDGVKNDTKMKSAVYIADVVGFLHKSSTEKCQNFRPIPNPSL